MRFKLLLFVVMLMGVASFASAQDCPTTPSGVVATPTQICITASPQHSTTDVDHPVVSGYSMNLCTAISETGVCTTSLSPVDLGKPTPTAQGKIIVSTAGLFGTLVPGTVYVAQVVVTGPAGSSKYPASNSFGVPAGTVPQAGAGTPVVTH